MAGRPLKFQTVDELRQQIDAYFAECDKHTRPFVTKEGEVIQVPDPIPYTITGVAMALDTTRQGLLNYEERDEYYDTIKNAKLKCENYAERQLFSGKNATGPIFNLKNNYGWVDKQEVDQTIANKNGEPFTVAQLHDLDKLTVEELKQLENILSKASGNVE